MKHLLLVLALAVLALGAWGEIVQIGYGSVINQGLPLESLSNYSYSQQLFLASEIGGSGIVTSLAFQYSLPSDVYLERNSGLSVWLGHTSRGELNAWLAQDSLSLVFDGELAETAFDGGLPGTGWMTVSLASSWSYNGEDNLLVAVRENSPGHSANNDEFLSSTATYPRGLLWLSPNPIEVDALPASGFFTRQAHPNLRLDIAVSHLTPYQPSPSNGASLVSIDTDFSWSSDASLFDFYYGTDPQTLSLVQSGLTQSSFFFTEPLALLTDYWWQVTAWQDGNSYPGQLWSFRTAGELLSPPQNFAAWYQDGAVQLSWDPPQSGTVQDYLVFRNEQQLAVTALTQHQDSAVNPGAVYYYHVKARNHLGQISLPSPTLSVHIPLPPDPNLILYKDFESEVLWGSVIPGWINLDLDGSPTWNWDAADWPGEGQPQGWIVFSPAATVPPLTTLTAHSGTRMMMAPDALNPPDNNWLISQAVNLGTDPSLSFWVRSATADYGLERLRVLISSSGTQPGDFIPLHAQAWLAVPAAWTQYQYDLDAWQAQTVRVAWQTVSVDALALFLDDVELRGEGGHTSGDDPLTPVPALSLWPNPSSGNFRISMQGKSFDLGIYDIRGRRIYNAKGLTSFENTDLDLPSGIYLIRTSHGKTSHSARLVIIR